MAEKNGVRSTIAVDSVSGRYVPPPNLVGLDATEAEKVLAQMTKRVKVHKKSPIRRAHLSHQFSSNGGFDQLSATVHCGDTSGNSGSTYQGIKTVNSAAWNVYEVDWTGGGPGTATVKIYATPIESGGSEGTAVDLSSDRAVVRLLRYGLAPTNSSVPSNNSMGLFMQQEMLGTSCSGSGESTVCKTPTADESDNETMVIDWIAERAAS